MKWKRLAIATSAALAGALGIGAAVAVAVDDKETAAIPPAREVPGDPELGQFPEVQGVPDSFRESLEAQRDAGWKAVVIEPGEVGYVAWEFNRPDDPARLGQWTPLVDSEGRRIGVFVHPVGYVPDAAFDAETFDWKAEAIRRGADESWVAAQIDMEAEVVSADPVVSRP